MFYIKQRYILPHNKIHNLYGKYMGDNPYILMPKLQAELLSLKFLQYSACQGISLRGRLPYALFCTY